MILLFKDITRRWCIIRLIFIYLIITNHSFSITKATTTTSTPSDTSSTTNRLIVHLSSTNTSPLKYLTFCLNCHSPDTEGSIMLGLAPKYGIHDYSVTGELVYCVPNYAESKDIYNIHHLHQKIVFVDRGEISFYDKIIKIQKQTKANAIIIADNGDCDDSFQFCQSSRIGGVKEGGFAAYDDESLWKMIDIPVILISQNTAERLRKLMNIKRQYIPGLGYHNISIDSLTIGKSLNSLPTSEQLHQPPPQPSTPIPTILQRDRKLSSNNNRKDNRNPIGGRAGRKPVGSSFSSGGNSGNLFGQDSLERMAGGSSMNNPFVPPTLPPAEKEEIDLNYIEDLRAIDDYHNQIFAESGEDEFDLRHYHHRHLLHGHHQQQQQKQRKSEQGHFPFDEL